MSGSPDAFIAAAPDAQASTKAVEPTKRSSKTPISLTVAPDLLSDVDRVAKRLGVSRAAAISMALARFVEAEDSR
ncbi:CopG family transcriptional regulator [Burkholderia cenocepacia]|uniref:CopG family transcriptional regulator n=1 Tax=Burkholderia cenocepacia TaxID=95486 RepID=UPI001B8FA978|nr:CopG family transcriptional regulator [Burkholderia cenocepacia]MBR8137208.1 CopG family transcriptional regulator [Burkholderia cenocepacia]